MEKLILILLILLPSFSFSQRDASKIMDVNNIDYRLLDSLIVVEINLIRDSLGGAKMNYSRVVSDAISKKNCDIIFSEQHVYHPSGRMDLYTDKVETNIIDEASKTYNFKKGTDVVDGFEIALFKIKTYKLVTYGDVAREIVKLWETLKNDPEHIGYAVYSLEEFNRTFPEYKWQYVFCNTEDGIKQELKEIPKAPEEDEVAGNFNAVNLPIEFPVNGPSNTFFEDNKWAPTQAFADSLEQEVLAPLREIKAGLNVPEGEPSFFLEELEIITSCSRFRNTGEAKDLTFKQLSENRNNAAKEFILGKLKELGVIVDGDSEITQNSDGENGDGSSGPNTPEGLFVATDGKEATALPPNSTKARDLRDEYGAPFKDKKVYDDYKYCIAGMAINANTKYKDPKEEPGDEDEEPKMEVITIDVPTKEYNVSFYSKPKYIGISFKLPKIIMDWKKRVKRPKKHKLFKGKKKKFKTTLCPKF